MRIIFLESFHSPSKRPNFNDLYQISACMSNFRKFNENFGMREVNEASLKSEASNYYLNF